jgi:type II secretory pathway pseudopilin PulG
MKIRLAIALIGLAIGFALPTFAKQKDTVNPQIEQQIRALAMKFEEAYNRNDAAAVAALYTEEVRSEIGEGTTVTMRIPLRNRLGVGLESPEAITSDLRELASH